MDTDVNRHDRMTGCLGEAAGIAIGLVKLGTCDLAAITDMLTYARESQHEKILRGLAVGLALTLYGRLEEADHCIGELSRDKDPILRWAAALAIAAAYAGTANNQAVRQLLHMAVSDVADDVRRAAVSAIGFVLFRSPEQCPTVVSLLAESYNPHVRFAAAVSWLLLPDFLNHIALNYIQKICYSISSAHIYEIKCSMRQHFCCYI